MKKTISLIVAILLIISMIPKAFAALEPPCPVCGVSPTACPACGGEMRYCECGCARCGFLLKDGDAVYTSGTTISAVGTKSCEYVVTVPAALTPGNSGTVTAYGAWGAGQTLSVTCPTSVDLYNGSDKISVGITFTSINRVGNNSGEKITATSTVRVGSVNTDELFGTWTGILNYTVTMSGN